MSNTTSDRAEIEPQTLELRSDGKCAWTELNGSFIYAKDMAEMKTVLRSCGFRPVEVNDHEKWYPKARQS